MNLNIVIDTNVLLTALKSSRGTSFRLLSMVAGNRFRVHVSAPLIAEYEAVLKREGLALSMSEIDDVIDFLCSKAIGHEIFYLWRPMLKDPDDDFLLELAFKAGASIVTWNLADFKPANQLGVRVVTPRELLLLLEG